MSPLLVVVLLAAAVCAFCWIASLITKDNSWVDRLWSIVPVVYVWIFAIAAVSVGRPATRLLLMAILVTLFRTRRTINVAEVDSLKG